MAWSWEVVVVVDALAWTLVSFGAGWWATRARVERLRDGPVTRLRPSELGGEWYRRRLRIHRWKHRLPEAGAVFGGMSKRCLPHGLGRDGALARYALECRRGERAHWAILATAPLFALWNPPGLFAVMVAYAVVVNGPCLAVLRFNRARCVAAMARARRHRERPNPRPSRMDG